MNRNRTDKIEPTGALLSRCSTRQDPEYIAYFCSRVMYGLSIFFVPRALPFWRLGIAVDVPVFHARVPRRQHLQRCICTLHTSILAAWLETRSRTRPMRRDKLFARIKWGARPMKDARNRMSKCAKNVICQTMSRVISCWNYFDFLYLLSATLRKV